MKRFLDIHLISLQVHWRNFEASQNQCNSIWRQMPTIDETKSIPPHIPGALPSVLMGYPRKLFVPADIPGIYHCVSRCVRRAFLCGFDEHSGRSFEHRKYWIEHRILALARVFSVAIHAYAVMSNHVHLVVEVDPLGPNSWTDEEVAERWLTIFAGGVHGDAPLASQIAAITSNSERINVLRQRLGSLSWFMRSLNEPIARRANREDGCTGRFWEGRFKCQVLLDDAALLACMAYVDLNPVRAGIAQSPKRSAHTSAQRRARRIDLEQKLSPVSSSIAHHAFDFSEGQYLELLDWTGRTLHAGKKGTFPSLLVSVLARISLDSNQWLYQVPATESHYWRAVGSLQALLDHAHRLSRHWLKGVGFARRLLSMPRGA